MVASGWSEAQIRAYVIADNKLAENAGWDEDILRNELSELLEFSSEIEIMSTGFEMAEIDHIVGRAGHYVSAGGERGRGNSLDHVRQRHDGRQVEEGRGALFEAERRSVHVAVGDLGDLVDGALLEAARTGGTEAADEVDG